MSSEPPRLSGEAYAVERLRDNPQLDYETLRKEAEQDGLSIQPIQYGRARRQLGLTGVPPAAAQAAVKPNAIEANAVEPTERAAPTEKPAQQEASASAQVGGSESTTADAPALSEAPSPQPQPAASSPPASSPPANSQTGSSSRPKSTPAFEFLVESLRAEPTISYGELKARADGLELKIAPIMYGRAKALLGLVPVRPRGQGKNRKQPPASSVAPTLPPAKASTPSQFSKQLERVRNVDDLVQIVKHLDGERRRLRSLLEQIANSIDEALGYDDETAD